MIIPGTNYFTRLDDNVNIALTTDESRLTRFAECTGDPNVVALHQFVYQNNCIMSLNQAVIAGGVFVMTGSPEFPSWTPLSTIIGPGFNFSNEEIPLGFKDGVNTIFDLANTPNGFIFWIVLNGAIQQSGGGDYTLSGNTITFNTAPSVSSILLAYYSF